MKSKLHLKTSFPPSADRSKLLQVLIPAITIGGPTDLQTSHIFPTCPYEAIGIRRHGNILQVPQLEVKIPAIHDMRITSTPFFQDSFQTFFFFFLFSLSAWALLIVYIRLVVISLHVLRTNPLTTTRALPWAFRTLLIHFSRVQIPIRNLRSRP